MTKKGNTINKSNQKLNSSVSGIYLVCTAINCILVCVAIVAMYLFTENIVKHNMETRAEVKKVLNIYNHTDRRFAIWYPDYETVNGEKLKYNPYIKAKGKGGRRRGK